MNFQPGDYQPLCLSAASMNFAASTNFVVWQPSWVDQMREARQWLEGIRAKRAAHEAWEFPSAPTFEPVALAA